MIQLINFELIQRRKALDNWLADCRRRMGLRFPKIEFDSMHWPIKTMYQTPQSDWYFTAPMADFETKDASYIDVLRCLVAEVVLAGKPKELGRNMEPYRLLASISTHRIFDLTLKEMRKIESNIVAQARANPSSAGRLANYLTNLAKLATKIAFKGVVPRTSFYPLAEVKAEMLKLYMAHISKNLTGTGSLLDRKIEAFNQTLNALADNDPRLSPMDRVAIATVTRELCAPSRINEVLCSSIDDHVTVEDYAEQTIGKQDLTHRAHQMLLVTMKGSKGGHWSAKPVLDFMIDTFHSTTGIILEYGKRSRMLVEWYQIHPQMLYLPPSLEHLRDKDITRDLLTKIVQLTDSPHLGATNSASDIYFEELKDKSFKAQNPNTHKVNGTLNARQIIEYLHWDDVEELLLTKVHRAMANCRKVTDGNHYQGDLSKMLFLFDSDKTPYLPFALRYRTIARRLKQTDALRARKTHPPTVFEKLDITMPVNGKIQIASIDTHDPRRWLTTMALLHGEKLSDVLINKWASRCRLSQLKAYDFRNSDELAEFSKMPQTPMLEELTDMSNGLVATERMEDQFGLKTAIVAAHNAGISMTSMDLVVQATENRPVAKTSRGIIILYPQRFGICLHQHHEKPCRNYSNSLVTSCVTCNEGAYIKGHIPSNDETRKVARQLLTSVLRQLENLAHTHNRGIADNQETLAEHMMILANKAATLEEVAVYFIEQFHELKHLIKDNLLARRLEEAFVTREVVKKLDSPNVSSGALIRYHNPTRHADPLLEVALDSHAGREQVAHDERNLIKVFPRFAPKALGLKDERHKVTPDHDNEDD